MALLSRLARVGVCFALTAFLVMPVAATVSVGTTTRLLSYTSLLAFVALPAAVALAEGFDAPTPRVWRTLLVFVAAGLAFGVAGTALLNAVAVTGRARDALVLAPAYALTYLIGWRAWTPEPLA
ncbi:hypothetical protein [Halocalculus aciditolerans]|uniref:Uncharacterized protein n=1 Tax=Halocalculus aciditolerans TaxID=1383812 RepID=A0A830FI72_9EURY|nr:hypothetical protein [Halocalculus aciditolerans]GGL49713.1 hypothetical protein GCM10009039_04830 [Halocalculus aciditolerans]